MELGIALTLPVYYLVEAEAYTESQRHTWLIYYICMESLTVSGPTSAAYGAYGYIYM